MRAKSRVYFAGESSDGGVFFLTNDPRMPIDDSEVWVGCNSSHRLTVAQAEARYGEIVWCAEPPLVHPTPSV